MNKKKLDLKNEVEFKFCTPDNCPSATPVRRKKIEKCLEQLDELCKRLENVIFFLNLSKFFIYI